MSQPVRSEVRFVFYAASVFICYLVYGMLQEKVTRGKYGPGEGEQFTYTLSLVLVQCITNYFFAKGLMMKWSPGVDLTRKSYYFASALTYLLGMVSSNMALQWINYPTQVVGKAAKPIPVMILGVLVGRKVYPVRKYLFILLIVAGCIVFMFKNQSKKGNSDSETVFGIGEILLCLSLIMDGLTGAVQDRIRSEGSPTALDMMLNTNSWSSIMLAVGVILSAEIFHFFAFIIKYPEIILYLGLLALCGALGQLFIFFLVSGFGPLPCSVVTTTRKFFTVLASVVIFGNVLRPLQWIGAAMVFSGLFLDIFFGKTSTRAVAGPQQSR